MKTPSLFLQMSLLKIVSVHAWCILSMLTAVLRCVPLNKTGYASLRNIFETVPFCHPYTNYHLEKDELNLFQNLHLYTQKSVLATRTRQNWRSWRKVSSTTFIEHNMLKLKIKKLLQKIVLKTLQLEFFCAVYANLNFSSP